ncbi:tail fiber domain-containing protein [Burkholderia sp. 22313]|uniref:tail fiber domain-containing protein n=1 Tax=Burkholderia sp. 22313 TaxID=3453908 RepID=UPI003F87F494
MNHNVDILSTQSPLTSAEGMITKPQTLTLDDHVGRRVRVNLVAAGTIKLPSSKKCTPDQVIHVRNVGKAAVSFAAEDGSGDFIGLSQLQPSESALVDTDGSTGWGLLYRSRASADDESVIGSLSVGGELKIAGMASFAKRPMFAGKTPWDSGNLDPGSFQPKGNYQPAGNYLVRGTGNNIAGSYFSSSIMPNIAGIDAGRYDACLTMSNSGNPGASAVIQFHREGSFAAYFGLDTDNYWKVGGRSMGANAHRIVHEGIDGAVLGGWLQINGARPMSYGNYGYLAQNGAGTNPGGVNVGVAIYCPNGRVAAGEFDALSDARLKTDIVKIDPARAVDFVRNVNAVAFRWKGDETDTKNFGFIAQEIGKAGFPELLRMALDASVEETVDDDGWVSPEGVRFSVNYDQVIPIHSSVLRSLLQRVEDLESRIGGLASRV